MTDKENKSAREMFEELEFIQQEEILGIIKYTKTIDSVKPTEYWNIAFHNGEEVITTYKTTRYSDRDYALSIFNEWIKSINKQIEELGWE